MRATIVGFCLGAFLCGVAFAEENKKGQVNIDQEKKEITYNLNKSGDLQIGGSGLPKVPESSKTEKDKREEQQNTGGMINLKKTFP